MYSYIGQLSRHLYCYVDTAYTHKTNQQTKFAPCVWFGLVAYPGRMWGCTIMLECGALYRNVPPHALSFSREPTLWWTPRDAQTWDCYGDRFSVIEYTYLSGLDCKVIANELEYEGSYLFTAAPFGDGFSAYPEQAKEFCFIELENGRLTVQPTNT